MTMMQSAALAFRFALRELRGGLSGFYVFLACIALGTAAIGGVNAVSDAITQGIQAEGRTILGGDVRFELIHRTTTAEEQATLEQFGDVAHSATTRSMARLADQSDQALVELKAVDDLYPLYGDFVTEPALGIDALGRVDGVWGAVAQPILFDRLGIAPGEQILLGNARVELRGAVLNEPDALSDGLSLAPRLILPLEALEATGLIQPGSLVNHVYKVRMGDGVSDARIDQVIRQASEAHPSAGWDPRSRANAAPALAANVDRFAQFLTLVGLTALVTGGVGVANAVRSFLDSKRDVIATFKCLGAPGSLVTSIYLIQILMIALLGMAVGLVLAVLSPFVAKAALAGIIPLPQTTGLYPGALAMAVVFAVLTVFVFALIPLGRARRIPASNLFRNQTIASAGLPPAAYSTAAAIAAVLLAGLAVWFSDQRLIAVLFLGGVVFSFIVLRIVSFGLQALARRVGRVRGASLRMAIANIHRPGALTPSVVLALGLGLTLLVSLALIDTNLRQQIAGNLPEQAPNFFFVDIQSAVVDDFAELVETEAGADAQLVRVPMLRGRLVALNGVDVREIELPPESEWVLEGDRGITYATDVPANSTLSDGAWWPTDHSGDALVSFSAEEGRELGLELGDTITVNVLGRDITATIASFRQLEWESLAINFIMVFSPNTFAGAPHAWLATLTMPDAAAEDEAAILSSVTRAFPAITTVRVKDAIDIVNRVIAQLATAIRAAAAVALIASVLVLAGALAAGNRSRAHDAVVLKTLGATRKTLIGTFVTEYAILGFATAVFALSAGGFAAWFIVTQIMTLPWAFRPEIALATVIAALVLTVGFGLAGTWRVLGQKAAPVLRNL